MIKGQTGAEVFIIVGVVLVLFIPFILGLYMEVNSFTDQINVNQADRIALELANAADSMYASGPGSNLSFSFQMPSGVEKITVQGREIVFTMRVSGGGTTDVVRLTKATVYADPAAINSIKQPGAYVVSVYSERVSGNSSRVVIAPA